MDPFGEITEVFRNHAAVQAAWLFGSVAQERARPDGGLDAVVIT